MHEVIEAKLAEIERLCRQHSVRRLDLFGSAAGERDSFDVTTSDVDVLVEFEVGPGFDHFGAYFGLKEGLERVLERSVDLVSATSIRNPYFEREVLNTCELLYAA